ncbi:copper homeostasis protein CutC [Glutamicibacter sp.]|uniref:copper homeostasis protein CutC n=1 Tax=Glutamicibacter sp. TaxID=1931995 RepID=UPI0028BEE0D2|nr:copper homeostasis protein CutC [Glutamicibacter sp.]
MEAISKRHPALEIVATSGVSARLAAQNGADRIEACEALELGGLTPSPEVLADILEHRPRLGIHALLRSRPGDFHYDALDVSVMRRQARRLALAGVDGVVLGALNAQRQLDLETIQILADSCLEVNPELEITVHRAIDASTDPVHAVSQLLALGVRRVLTSGGRESAGDGMGTITQMVHQAKTKIQIMSGGGMRVQDIATATMAGVCAVHFSAKTPCAGTIRVSADQVRELRSAVDALER